MSDEWFAFRNYSPNNRLESLFAFLDTAQRELEHSTKRLREANDQLEHSLKRSYLKAKADNAASSAKPKPLPELLPARRVA